MVFLALRQQSASIQAILSLTATAEDPHQVSKQMLKWAASIPNESIVLVEGEVKESKEEIKSASIKHAEVIIRKVCAVGSVCFCLSFLTSSALSPHSDPLHGRGPGRSPHALRRRLACRRRL